MHFTAIRRSSAAPSASWTAADAAALGFDSFVPAGGAVAEPLYPAESRQAGSTQEPPARPYDEGWRKNVGRVFGTDSLVRVRHCLSLVCSTAFAAVSVPFLAMLQALLPSLRPPAWPPYPCPEHTRMAAGGNTAHKGLSGVI